MRTVLLLALVALSVRDALAQPADCLAEPGFTETIPLDLQLQGLPGVPTGLSGQFSAGIPAPPPGGTVCRADPRPFSGDVLGGPAGDVLGGSPVRDVLRGPAPRVTVEPGGPPDFPPAGTGFRTARTPR